jgi:ketosteroid isomerase-like protein
MRKPDPSVVVWLREFAAAVRARDLARGRVLFTEDVIAFGTVSARVASRAVLEREQWSMVWFRTVDFDFNYESVLAAEEGDLVVVAADWSSTAATAGAMGLRRNGRATLALRRCGQEWRACHSHFSINPQGEHDPLLRARTQAAP